METDTQLNIKVSKHQKFERCGKPYSMKIGCTVWREIKKSTLQYGVKKSK